ncbi:hypothetical protein VCHENC02_5646A, partial [Vibrio harveyi]
MYTITPRLQITVSSSVKIKMISESSSQSISGLKKS